MIYLQLKCSVPHTSRIIQYAATFEEPITVLQLKLPALYRRFGGVIRKSDGLGMGTAPNKPLCILCYINDMKSGTACCFVYYFSFRYFSCLLLIQPVFIFSFLAACIFIFRTSSYYFLCPSRIVFPPPSNFCFFVFIFSFLFYPLLTLLSFISHSPSLMFFHLSWYPLLFLSLHHFISFTLSYFSPLWTHTP